MNTSTCFYTDFLIQEFTPYLEELNKDPYKNYTLIHQAMLRNIAFYERCKKEKRIRPTRPMKPINCLGITITASPEHCDKIPDIFNEWCFNDLNILDGIRCTEYGGLDNDKKNTHIHARLTLSFPDKRDYNCRRDPYPSSTLKGDYGDRESAPKRGLRHRLHQLFPFPTNIVILHSNQEDLDSYIMKHGVWFDINAPIK